MHAAPQQNLLERLVEERADLVATGRELDLVAFAGELLGQPGSDE